MFLISNLISKKSVVTDIFNGAVNFIKGVSDEIAKLETIAINEIAKDEKELADYITSKQKAIEVKKAGLVEITAKKNLIANGSAAIIKPAVQSEQQQVPTSQANPQV